MSKFSTVILIFCFVIQIRSDCDKNDETLRVKRSKYYPNPPQRFYRRPPVSYPIKGAFSFTPPPSYMLEDSEYPYRPSKVSKRPTNEGLDDEEINNLIKHLSKKELDKILEFASDTQSDRLKYNNDFNNKPSYKRPIDENRFSNGPYLSDPDDNQFKNFNGEPKVEFQEDYVATQPRIVNKQTTNYQQYDNYENQNFNNDASQVNLLYSNKPEFPPLQPSNFYQLTNYQKGPFDREEELPLPMNLRETDDYDGSYTHNVPTVVKSESYKVESFGDLPLMNYHNSKLHSVSSYYVPHYTVTSKTPTPTPQKSPPYEPAPPGARGDDQSDAHLKAIKIWTHMSKGTAYTLNDDGTLSLEKPVRPTKPVYG